MAWKFGQITSVLYMAWYWALSNVRRLFLGGEFPKGPSLWQLIKRE